MWKSWFAWYPVKTLGGRWVWLRDVEYKSDPHNESDIDRYIYRMPKVSFWVHSSDALRFRLLARRQNLINEIRGSM